MTLPGPEMLAAEKDARIAEWKRLHRQAADELEALRADHRMLVKGLRELAQEWRTAGDHPAAADQLEDKLTGLT